ncbi:MAG TPA: S8 family serine peptidase [Longimicrobium sp.]|nr:S8 family serine peptidase [Longimicrobium sp.]
MIEFRSLNYDLRDIFEVRLQASVVDERRTPTADGDHYRYLVQFADAAAVRRFRAEIAQYIADGDQRAVLPPGLRRDFFDCLQEIRPPARDDRVGVRLAREGIPELESFYLDLDLWHPGAGGRVQQLLTELRSLCDRHGGALVEQVNTESLLLAKVRANDALTNALLDWDVVARVDLPPLVTEAYRSIFVEQRLPDNEVVPTDEDPIACVLDSGVVAGHPLLRNWIIDERDFETGENTPTDQNGHGTSVSGLVTYGDIAECLMRNEWRPKVRVCSAKILRDDPVWERVVFPEEHRIERVVEEAIRFS